MRASDASSNQIILHGAYVCLRLPPEARGDVARIEVPAMVECLGLHNEFAPADGDAHARGTVAFLRRVDATPGAIADARLLHADAVVHVAAASAAPVTGFCAQLKRRLGPALAPRVLDGVLRPPSYTGAAMHDFAYARRVLQQPGTVMPHAFLAPTSKTGTWWAKDWMERHTYFLPRYDDAGSMRHQGHALAAEAGIACLMRRTYKHAALPAPPGAYDFINYFECTDADVPKYHEVRAALRDVARNPEWQFVREGPTWHGRRVETWAELCE